MFQDHRVEAVLSLPFSSPPPSSMLLSSRLNFLVLHDSYQHIYALVLPFCGRKENENTSRVGDIRCRVPPSPGKQGGDVPQPSSSADDLFEGGTQRQQSLMHGIDKSIWARGRKTMMTYNKVAYCHWSGTRSFWCIGIYPIRCVRGIKHGAMIFN